MWPQVDQEVGLVQRIDGVMVRVRSIQSQEREVSMEILDKLVGCLETSMGVGRARVDQRNEDVQHVIPARDMGEDGVSVTREPILRSG